MTLQVKNKADGKVYPIHKYILSSDGIESVWCNDWYGHHRIGFDCEWATHDRAKVLVDALEECKHALAMCYNVVEWPADGSTQQDRAIAVADKALQHWNGPDRPCPHCGKELSRDRNLCCRECGKEVELAQQTSTYSFSSNEKKKLLADKIEHRMKEIGLHRQQFADLMGVQPSTITRWLSGEHNFQIDTLFEIEKKLNIPLFNL